MHRRWGRTAQDEEPRSRRRSARSSSRTPRSPPASPWPTHVPPGLFHHIKPGRLAATLVPEELEETGVVPLAVVKREPSGIFSGTRPLQQGDEGCITESRGVHEPDAQGCGCVVRRDGIDGGGNRIHPPRADRGAKGVPLGSSRDISIRAEFPASTRHVPLATRRATDQTTG